MVVVQMLGAGQLAVLMRAELERRSAAKAKRPGDGAPGRSKLS